MNDEEKKDPSLIFELFIGLGAILGLWRLKMLSDTTKSPVSSSLKSLSKSYKISCERFKIENQTMFGKFHKLLVKQTFESFDIPTIKILDFQNYVLGYCKRYIDDMLKFGGVLYCKLNILENIYGQDKAIPEWNEIYYILSLDSIMDLGSLLPVSEQGKYKNIIAPQYIQILADFLKFDQDDINNTTELYLQYKETGEI